MTAGTVGGFYPSVLYCISKRTKEDCDRGSKSGTVHSRQEG